MAKRRLGEIAFLLLLSLVVRPAVPAVAPHDLLVVTVERIEDTNGDGDGQLDTNETGEIVLGLSNKSDVSLRHFDVRLRSLDGRFDALSPAVHHVPFLAGHATLALPPTQVHVSALADRGGPTVTCQNPGPAGTCSNFVVVPGGCIADANCRLSETQSFHGAIAIELIGAFQLPYFVGYPPDYRRPFEAVPDVVVIDLDLDSSHPAQVTTTFSEQFDLGNFGAFAPASLDTSIASNAASNGARCQYSDPDYPQSNTYGETECYLGFAAGQSPVNDWHNHGSTSPDGGRAFTGTRSLHYGRHVQSSGVRHDTTPLSQLDTIRLNLPVHLASRVCESDPAPSPRACAADADCVPVGGGSCVGARPALSFKQQVSLVDGRCTGTPWGQSADRAVVAVQQDGSAVWEKLYPSVNVYDAQGTDFFTNCTFDPTDDGNTEDSYFDPTDPLRRLGPSTSCFPGFVFAYLGDTDAPFQASEIGQASDGPGLQGAVGPGTWVESRFDLSRYRGRSIRVRFLVSTIKVSDNPTMEQMFGWNPIACDDGWWLDDVQISETLGATTPTVTADAADRGALPGALDTDGDGRPDAFDCAPADGGAFAVPSEVFDLRASDHTTLSWESALSFAGSATVHEVARGLVGQWPVGAGASETCIGPGTAASSVIDPATPGLGSAFWYLVRARNSCGAGVYGYDELGAVQTTTACP